MIGATAAGLGLGLLLGMVSGWSHLLLLRRALNVMQEQGATLTNVRRTVVKGLPARVLLWTPAAIIVGHAGLGACIGLVLGMVVSRWLYWRKALQPS